MTAVRITRAQAVAYRLAINRLIERLPAGDYVRAARFGLQDTAPRDALLGLHARVQACERSAWSAPGLVQTYSPRAAVYVLPADDFGVFTLGRLPSDPEVRRWLEDAAARICTDLDGAEGRGGAPDLRAACATGRIVLRWTTSALYFREVAPPEIDLAEARRELARRHLTAFGPTTTAAFAWWSGLPPADARRVFDALAAELIEVELDGRRAQLLASDEPLLRSPPDPGPPRLLVPSDLRLLGADRTGLFVGPGRSRLTALHDSFHPGGLLVDGAIVGAWGRRGGHVRLRLGRPLPPSVADAVEAEVASMPIPGARMRLSVTVVQ